jgi:hypothetical protein
VPAEDRQPYFAQLAQRQKVLQHQQQQQLLHSAAGTSSSGSSCAGLGTDGRSHDPGDAAAAVPGCLSQWRNMQLQHLEVTEYAPCSGGGLPQSAMLAARQQSNSSRSTAWLPALRGLIGGLSGRLLTGTRTGTLVFVNTAEGMVPLMK